ncbi:globin domain-containing protein [Phytoactinopolyspora endophytica]|uniref:globin domain-containing protein n=1 Tax=Phytoactinopolyspora endophytica TaxID=1642495 RepID=UPI00197B6FB5|nr:globin domain-containing protein [Phytoactinopolyspora endophytica]
MTSPPEPDASVPEPQRAAPEPVKLEPVPSSPMGLDTVALRATITLAEDKLDQLAQRFYANLFASHPELRDLFPASMETQRSRLVGALVRIVGSAENRDDIVSYLEGLGRDHRKFGVITEHYASLGSALVLAFRQELGDQWTERHEKAWIKAYDTIAMVMSESAERDAVMSPAWWDAEVVFHRRLLDDLAIIQARPHTDYPYRPGQYAYVMSPRRPKMWRAYSMASAPRDDGLVEFHVRAVGAGWVSSALVWRTEAGDVLRIGAPQGYDLANPRSERDLLCIAGGVGIAPILAGLQELEQRLDGRRVHVFYAGRDRDSLYALPHLESIGVRYRRLTVVPVVSPEGPEDRSPDLMGNIVSAYGDWREHDVYLAGPTSMVQAALNRLREQQIPEEQIVCDDYGTW